MKRSIHVLNNASGISIVETMIAAGIGTAVIMSMTQSTLMVNTQMKSISQGNDWGSLVTLMRQTYSNQKQCKNMFSGLVIAGSGEALSTTLDGLGTKSDKSEWVNKFLAVGTNLNGFQANSITLKAVRGNQTQTITGTGQEVWADQVFLTIRATRLSGVQATGLPGPSASPTPVPASLQVSSGLSSLSPDAISFTLYRNTGTVAGTVAGMVVDCSNPIDTANASCTDIESDSVYFKDPNGTVSPDGRVHATHAHKNCSIRKLAVNPRNDLATSRIAFGDAQTGQEEVMLTPSTHAFGLKVNGFEAANVAYDPQGGSSKVTLRGKTTIFRGTANFKGAADLTGDATAATAQFNSTGNAKTISGNVTAKSLNLTANDGTGEVPHGCVVRTVANRLSKCLTGEIAIGGGGQCTGGTVLSVSSPYYQSMYMLDKPKPSPEGWYAVCYDLGKNSITYDVGVYSSAVCCAN